MFGFLQDMGNYETRKVGNDKFDWGFVSTCRVSDGRKPYETAVEHNRYVRADGKRDEMCIVENYDTREEAEKGHAKWVAAMTGKDLPATLTDCCNSEVAEMLEAVRDGDHGLVWTLDA
jgi:hypothetical protein